MWLHHAGCFGRCTNALNFWMAIRVEINLSIQFCSCNFFNKKITHRDTSNRMRFALIFVLIVTMLCQSTSLASNFTFLASNFSLWETNKNTFPGFVYVSFFFLCRCSGFRSCYYQCDFVECSLHCSQCYWRAAMRNIRLPYIYPTGTVGDGSYGSKFTAIFLLR